MDISTTNVRSVSHETKILKYAYLEPYGLNVDQKLPTAIEYWEIKVIFIMLDHNLIHTQGHAIKQRNYFIFLMADISSFFKQLIRSPSFFKT